MDDKGITDMDGSSLIKVRDKELERIGKIFSGFRKKLIEIETLIKRELGE